MVMGAVNFTTALIAAVVGMLVGFLWYSPFLFGSAWMKLMNLDKKKMEAMKKKGMGKTYLTMFITTLIMTYVLAYFVQGAATMGEGIQVAFWIWLGFLATSQLGIVLWDNKPFKLYLINTLHYLVALAIMAAILVAWA